MAKLIIYKGLPACGKSTAAEEQIKKEGNTVRLNKDLLRTMLHFDKFTHVNEGRTRDATRTLATMYLKQGVNVIIDDTNLNPRTVQSWVDLAKECDAKIEYKEFDVDVNTCIARDRFRDKKVGASVILKMALQHKDYMKGESVVVCDIDGTIANLDHRLQYGKGDTKDWNKFFELLPEDKVRSEVINQVTDLVQKHYCSLLIVSARPEKYRKETEEWLDKAFAGKVFGKGRIGLIMREDNDKRPDTEVKSDIYDKYLSKLDIVTIFDDRPSVIRMWREKGLDVTDVGAGIEF